MALLPKVVVNKPPRSHHDLGFVNRFSAAPGVLIPVVTKFLTPGQQCRQTLHCLIKTIPPLGPVMGSFKVQFDTFFCPIRFYNRLLHDNRTNFDPQNVEFPLIRLGQYSTNSTTPPPYRGVSPSSALHFLGIAEYFVATSSTTFQYRYFNMIPLLALWDIWRSYYCNTQEERGYFVGVSNITGEDQVNVVPFDLNRINDMRQNLLSSPIGTPYVHVSTAESDPYNVLAPHYSLGGLPLRTYLPDLFTAFVNSEYYENTLTSAIVDTSTGSFDLDSLRFADKLNRMLQKTLISGGRYSDWQLVQYGTSLKHHIEAPTFVSSHSTELTFEDVVQTTGHQNDESPLGSLGSRGLNFMGNRTSRYYATEHGYLMTIMSIIPRVDYYQGVKYYMRHRTLADVHVPAMDGIGFQDLLGDDFYAATTNVEQTALYPESYIAFAKQPAWVEYMSAVNELHGDFAEQNKLMYLVLARRFYQSGAVTNFNFTSYINPKDFNYMFADSSLTAQNFWVQLKVGFNTKLPMSKRVMPNL